MSAARILVHDYAGHVAQVEVSRELARRGYQVLHLYAAGLETPRGALERRPGDPPTFDVQPVFFKGKFQKHNYVRRQIQEIEYGTPLTKAALAFKPDIVLSANTPLIPQAQLQWACSRAKIPFIFWMTDIYCLAVQGGVREKLGCLGRAIVSFYRRLERFLVRRADGVIVITARFKEILASWGVNRKDIQVIPVCAPFEEICVGCKDNEWARNVGISRTRNIVYAGTLGTKHNPSLLVALGRHFRDQDDIRLVVITAGPGARYLQRQASQENLNNIILLPFQPFEHLSNILASADILLALLEPDAASYSIPSKVLSQLCSGRPQVISVPEDNVVSQIVKNAGAGIVLPPGNEAKFVEAIAELLADPVSQKRMGDAGRKYVEATLGITALANNYVALMEAIFSARSPVCDNGCSQMPGFTGKSGYPLL